MTTVGTGTRNLGGYRLTPALRRFSMLALGLLVTATTMLVGPAYVRAADPWSREVEFSPDEIITETARLTLNSTCGVQYRERPSSTFDAVAPRQVASATFRVALTVDGGCRTAGGTIGTRMMGFGYATGGTWPYSSVGDPGTGLTETQTVRVTGFGGGTSNCGVYVRAQQYGGTTGSSILSTLQLVPNMTEPGTFSFNTVFTLPVNTRILQYHMDQWCYITSLSITDEDGEAVEGDCDGTGGLAWQVAGLTTGSGHTQWGDEYLADVDGCLFTNRGLYHYAPPEGFLKGETHLFAATISAEEGRTGRLTFRWSCGANSTAILLEVTSSGPEQAAVTLANFPPLTSTSYSGCIRIDIEYGTILHHLRLANVDGTSEDDGSPVYGDMTSNPGGVPWSECDVPGDADFELFGFEFSTPDVAGWTAFVGCLIIGLPGAIADAFTALLEDLFVPTEVGDRWASFMDLAETRAPFGWFAQVSAVISSSAGAGADALGAFNLTIGSATVSIGSGIQSALAGVSPYRGLIFAGVALTMTLGCLHWIMAAVGVSPSKGGGGDAA